MLVPCILLAGLLFGAFRLNSLSSAGTPCILGACPLAIHENDSGKTFVYSVGARFNVYLNERTNPQNTLGCTPAGTIELQQYAPAEPPVYVAVFETSAMGTCVLSSKSFFVTIVTQ